MNESYLMDRFYDRSIPYDGCYFMRYDSLYGTNGITYRHRAYPARDEDYYIDDDYEEDEYFSD